MHDLSVVNKTDAQFNDNIFHNLSQLLPTGSNLAVKYITDRLICSKVLISTKISLNHFILPGNKESKKKRKGVAIDKRLTPTFLNILRAAIMYRRDHAKLLFKTAIFNYSQCLSTDCNTLYHGMKSDILRRFDQTSSPEILTSSSAIIFELSPLLRLDFKADTFSSFTQRTYTHIIKLGREYTCFFL